MGGVLNLGMGMEGHCDIIKKVAPDDDGENCESGFVHVPTFVTSTVPMVNTHRLGECQAKDAVLSTPPGSRTKRYVRATLSHTMS